MEFVTVTGLHLKCNFHNIVHTSHKFYHKDTFTTTSNTATYSQISLSSYHSIIHAPHTTSICFYHSRFLFPFPPCYHLNLPMLLALMKPLTDRQTDRQTRR